MTALLCVFSHIFVNKCVKPKFLDVFLDHVFFKQVRLYDCKIFGFFWFFFFLVSFLQYGQFECKISGLIWTFFLSAGTSFDLKRPLKKKKEGFQLLLVPANINSDILNSVFSIRALKQDLMMLVVAVVLQAECDHKTKRGNKS